MKGRTDAESGDRPRSSAEVFHPLDFAVDALRRHAENRSALGRHRGPAEACGLGRERICVASLASPVLEVRSQESEWRPEARRQDDVSPDSYFHSEFCLLTPDFQDRGGLLVRFQLFRAPFASKVAKHLQRPRNQRLGSLSRNGTRSATPNKNQNKSLDSAGPFIDAPTDGNLLLSVVPSMSYLGRNM